MSKIKENVKKFWEENKRDILYYTAGAVVGGVVMYQFGKCKAIPFSKETRTRIGKVLSYGDKGHYSVFTSAGDHILNPKQLGELGQKMIELGMPEDNNLQRFIVIGDPYMNKK